jgi:2-amino-1-hydroxyethylphosphonate dioxygenase (glycine-forming)
MKQTAAQIEQVIDEIFGLYGQFGGNDYIGEPVSQLEHMSQSAQLAIAEGYDDEVVLAAFFHDIGHICVAANVNNSMDGYGIKRHEQVGAEYLLNKGFSPRVARLVENHVQAKRYLTFADPSYFDALSEASRRTLEFQGGRMTQQEALAFEQDPLFDASIQMRKWDELAKEMHVAVIDLNDLKNRVRHVLSE